MVATAINFIKEFQDCSPLSINCTDDLQEFRVRDLGGKGLLPSFVSNFSQQSLCGNIVGSDAFGVLAELSTHSCESVQIDLLTTLSKLDVGNFQLKLVFCSLEF